MINFLDRVGLRAYSYAKNTKTYKYCQKGVNFITNRKMCYSGYDLDSRIKNIKALEFFGTLGASASGIMTSHFATEGGLLGYALVGVGSFIGLRCFQTIKQASREIRKLKAIKDITKDLHNNLPKEHKKWINQILEAVPEEHREVYAELLHSLLNHKKPLDV